MKTLLRLSLLACLLLVLPVLSAAAEEAPAPAGVQAPEVASSATPAPEVLPFLQELDPLAGVQYAACTCDGQAAACSAKCDICPDCYGAFTCNVADPCHSRCLCRILNP